MSDFCPDCDSILPVGADKCSCGWVSNDKQTKNKNTKPMPEPSFICQWSNEHMRCPMPSARMSDGRALCQGHAITAGDLDKSIKLFQKIDELMDGNATRTHDVAVGCYKRAFYWRNTGKGQDVLCINHAILSDCKKRTKEWFIKATAVIRELVENNYAKELTSNDDQE